MKKINTFVALLLMAAAAMFSTSCENDNPRSLAFARQICQTMQM